VKSREAAQKSAAMIHSGFAVCSTLYLGLHGTTLSFLQVPRRDAADNGEVLNFRLAAVEVPRWKLNEAPNQNGLTGGRWDRATPSRGGHSFFQHQPPTHIHLSASFRAPPDI